MANAGGYILRLTTERLDIFHHAISDDGRFGQAVPTFKHSRNAPLVCFIVDPKNQITHVARGRRGLRAGTQQSRLNIEDVNRLSSVVHFDEIVDGVPNKNTKVVEDRFRNGGVLSPKAFQETIDLIVELAPEIADLIQRFTTSTRDRLKELSPEMLDNLAYQKEAVASALSLAGINREPLGEWTMDTDVAPKSFLDGLLQVRMREDPMVIQDMRQVPGYEYLRDVPNASAAVFADGDEHLTIIMANRQPLEQQTGTDLIYYNQKFKAFIMVQYKAMESDDGRDPVFRFPESNLADEIQRMDEFLEELAKVQHVPATDDFRLNSNPFFLKFCPRIQFEPDSTGLTKGMYIPHHYWKLLEQDDRLKGPRGGRRLTYSNAGRYLTNTSFAAMVKGAWVGTTIPQSELLEGWMKDIVTSGRSITFAVKADTPDPDGVGDHVINPNLDLDGQVPAAASEHEQVQLTHD